MALPSFRSFSLQQDFAAIFFMYSSVIHCPVQAGLSYHSAYHGLDQTSSWWYQQGGKDSWSCLQCVLWCLT